MVYVKSRHELPEFMAAVTITINFMVMAAPVGTHIFDRIPKRSIHTLMGTCFYGYGYGNGRPVETL
jgi:hypothetical protein